MSSPEWKAAQAAQWFGQKRPTRMPMQRLRLRRQLGSALVPSCEIRRFVMSKLSAGGNPEHKLKPPFVMLYGWLVKEASGRSRPMPSIADQDETRPELRQATRGIGSSHLCALGRCSRIAGWTQPAPTGRNVKKPALLKRIVPSHVELVVIQSGLKGNISYHSICHRCVWV